MRILLILASDLTYKYKNIFTINNGFAPLSLTTIAGSIPDKYANEIKIIDEGMQKVNYDKLIYDVVGISCCTSSANRAYQLAEYWKKRGAYTIIGGHHATLNADEASKYCDSVICGFGEYVFPQILEDITIGKTEKIYYAECNQFYDYISPRRDLIKHIPYFARNTIYATRGCVNNCKYCSVNNFTKSNYIKRPVSEIVDEITSNNFKKFFFLDSNFTADREYTKELLTALIPLKVSYYADVTADTYMDSELVDLFQKSGCFEVFIGFETNNNVNLVSNNKKINNILNYKACVETFHNKNIFITGGFMLGMDNDTEDSLVKLPDFIEEIGVDIIRYTIFTPLPGTKIFENYKKENRILTYNYDYYDFMHTIHKPLNMDALQLQQLFKNIWTNTYSTKRVLKRISQKNFNLDIYLANLYFKLLGQKIPDNLGY